MTGDMYEWKLENETHHEGSAPVFITSIVRF